MGCRYNRGWASQRLEGAIVGPYEGLQDPGKRAREIFNDAIKPMLTVDDLGRYIAIDLNTGDWMIGDTEDVMIEMFDSVKSSRIFLIHHPRIASVSFGGLRSSSFE